MPYRSMRELVPDAVAMPGARSGPDCIRVVFASAELAPFAKTGGLADVAASLTGALAERGADITLMLPLYRCVRESGIPLRPLEPHVARVPLGTHVVEIGMEAASLHGGRVRLVCLRFDPYFDRAELYGESGRDYPDNAHRFGLFSRAIIAASKALSLSPHLYHLHDWHTALVCALIKTVESGPARGARTVLTIHNVAYQGVFWKWDLPWTGLGWEQFTATGVGFYDNINFLKAGIEYADAITTVSPTYAREIQSGAGRGLDAALRHRRNDIVGIVNGIDTSVWNPAVDPHIPARYSSGDLSGKAGCKAALQEELGLPVAADVPVIGSIGRLVEQKGMNLLLEIADELFRSSGGCQLVVLGKGEPALEEALRQVERRWPENARAVIGFDDGLAHRIEAGCDMFVMPSLFEPCGLNQLYSMTYGTVPVVRCTGGLADTVEDAGTGPAEDGTGFVFDAFDAPSLLEAFRRALGAWRDRPRWGRIVARGMGRDWSWARSAAEYEKLYARVLARPPARGDDIGFPKAGLRP